MIGLYGTRCPACQYPMFVGRSLSMRSGVNIGATSCTECSTVIVFRSVADTASAESCPFDSIQAEQWYKEAYENAGQQAPPLLKCFDHATVGSILEDRLRP